MQLAFMLLGQLTQEASYLRQEGRINSTELIIDVLNRSSRVDLQEFLDAIPHDLLEELRHFVECYRPELRTFRGTAPDPLAVSQAKELLASSVKTS